jgi:hypothetical protein
MPTRGWAGRGTLPARFGARRHMHKHGGDHSLVSGLFWDLGYNRFLGRVTHDQLIKRSIIDH